MSLLLLGSLLAGQYLRAQSDAGQLQAQLDTRTGLDRVLVLNQLAGLYLHSAAGQAVHYSTLALAEIQTLRDQLTADPAAAGQLPDVLRAESESHLLLAQANESLGSRSKAIRSYKQAYRLAALVNREDVLSQAMEGLRRNDKDNSLDVAITRWTRERLEDLRNASINEVDFREKAQAVMSSSLEMLGRNAEKNGNYPAAIEYYEKALEMYRAENDTTHATALSRHIGDLYHRQGDEVRAQAYYAGADLPPGGQTSRKSQPVIDLAGTEAIIRNIAREKPQTLDGGSDEESQAQQAGEAYYQRAESAARNGRFKESYENLKRYTEYRELFYLLSAQRQQDSLDLQTQLQEISQLRLAQELQAEQIRRVSQFRNFLIVSLLLILAIAGLVTYLFFTKRQAHRQMTAAFNELAQTHRRLQSAQTQLVSSEKMASLGQLTAGIAHEINNPVNFISGNIHPLRQDVAAIVSMLHAYEEIIEQEQLQVHFEAAQRLREELELSYVTDEIQDLIDGIGEGAERTSEIVSSLRTFARLDESDRKRFDLHQGIDSTLALLRNRCQGIDILRDYGDVPEIEGYPGKLNQVFMNILTNAIQAMPEGGLIHIMTQRSGPQEVEIRIRDTGVGIPEAIQARIFEPFFTTKDVGEGTGLGLSITHSIIEQHRGHIDIQSVEGQGTEVIIRLPV
ncbi:MAG: hypothetical protein OHK0039_09410 [Bacteroidia bacterium]